MLREKPSAVLLKGYSAVMSKSLSVIIVNYNVSQFLKLCLYSVRNASKLIDAEVFVVDNASSDNSVEMVKSLFPEVKLIENKRNSGFAVANNQAIAKASGEIILLLNPDTIIPKNTFADLLDFYKKHPDTTGVGVKMIDGSGNYLPESKRGLPTPITSFYKFSGLIKLFPKSKKVAAYYAGHISPDETAQIPVLAGAFLAFPQKVLNRTEPLDESFFMYGEDIDFSYRLSREGSNYYTPEISIIHFKGESAKKDRIYLERFFDAMLIFARKHFFTEYSSFHKQVVIFSIKSMKLMFELLILFKSEDKKTKSVSHVNSFFVGSRSGYERLGDSTIKLCESFESVDTTVLKLKPNVFIDVRTVSVKDTIDFMTRYAGKFTFTFLSPDREFCLSSSDANSSGEITPLQ